MPQNEEPKWEVVDEIPGERPAEPSPRRPRRNPLTSKALWIGVGVGVLVMALFPPLFATVILMVRRAAAAWWLWLALAIYWYWRRMKQRPRKR